MLNHDTLTLHQLVLGGRGTDVQDTVGETIELVEGQGTIVQGCRQAKSVLYETDLTGAVSPVHRMDLRYCHVALVDDKEEVLGEVVQEAEGAFSWSATIEVTGVVLDTGAVA